MTDIESQLLKPVAVPGNFAVCSLSSCAKRHSCLRFAAAGMISADCLTVISINPNRFTSAQLAQGDCTSYVKTERVRLARGFISALNTVPIGNKKKVEKQLCARFCRAVFYRVRKGTRVLSPSEQRFVEEILLANGASSPIVFDAYEEDFMWDKE